jgi:hypothetical protein
MKLYFIPLVVFLMSINNSQNAMRTNVNEPTVCWLNEPINEEEFLIEELLYETNASTDTTLIPDSLQLVKQRDQPEPKKY